MPAENRGPANHRPAPIMTIVAATASSIIMAYSGQYLISFIRPRENPQMTRYFSVSAWALLCSVPSLVAMKSQHVT